MPEMDPEEIELVWSACFFEVRGFVSGQVFEVTPQIKMEVGTVDRDHIARFRACIGDELGHLKVKKARGSMVNDRTNLYFRMLEQEPVITMLYPYWSPHFQYHVDQVFLGYRYASMEELPWHVSESEVASA